MLQQGQVFELTSTGAKGMPLWAYRYRIGGRDGKRVQRGGFASAEDAHVALELALEKLRRRGKVGRMPTLAEFVDEYLAQHEASPVTVEKLRFLLDRAVAAFGDYRLDELNPLEIQRPFESWEEIEAVAKRLEPRLAAMVLFAAATGMRPGEWVALEYATSIVRLASPTSTAPSAKAGSPFRRRRRADAPYRCKQGRLRRSTTAAS
jgi:integrase